MTFNHIIKQLRDQADLSQQEVADNIGVARLTYAKLESGERQPKLDEIQALSRYYEVSTDELINGLVKEPTVKYQRQSQNQENIIPREIDPKVKPDKLRQVLLYVLGEVGGKPNVGETVLYKLLYFIDMDYYEKYGRSITGLTYINNTFGPTPKNDFRALVNDMKKHNEIDIIENKFFNNTQKKYLAQAEPDLSHLNGQEIDHINEVLSRLGDKNATELSHLSHLDTPWLATKPKQPIDYQLAMYRVAPTSVTGVDGEI